MKKLVLSLTVCLGLVSSSSYAGCAGLSGCLKEAGKIVSNESKTLGGQLSDGWKSAGLVVSEQYKHAVDHVVDRWHATYKNAVPEDHIRWILNSTAQLAALYPMTPTILWIALLERKVSLYVKLKDMGYFDERELHYVAAELDDLENTQTLIDEEYGDDSDASSDFREEADEIVVDFAECIRAADGDIRKQSQCNREKDDRKNDKVDEIIDNN